jgi:transposase
MSTETMNNTSSPELVKRWSARRKMEVVLRHLRGESLDALSREVGVPASQIEGWHQRALHGIAEVMKERIGDPLQEELDAATKRVGELSMEVELLRKKSAKTVFLPGRW